ncbi:LrgB family protein [Halalkalibacterium ligniniphilum]|uniref:LrgB family protein n=1 Tax=Halalkalibacterium ligniniphilum TaxID=1134413 RepID=UPI00034B209B|nr:LrgB family protein [Halalkalibacterium ligniniphilum]
MIELFLSIASIAFTVLVYMGARFVHMRFPHPLTLPLLIGTIFIISFLLLFRIPYEVYEAGGRWIEELLGPAVVALAYPLYRQMSLLKKYFFSILTGVMIGSIVGVISGFWLASWLGVEQELVHSIVPKSVTTPVAMDVTAYLNGNPPFAALFVIIAGIGGVLLAPTVFRWCKITHTLGKGIGMGTASHAVGTAKALENSEKEGAASSIAMTLSAIIVSILAPALVFILQS